MVILITITSLFFIPSFGLEALVSNAKTHEKTEECDAPKDSESKNFAFGPNMHRQREKATGEKGAGASPGGRKRLGEPIEGPQDGVIGSRVGNLEMLTLKLLTYRRIIPGVMHW